MPKKSAKLNKLLGTLFLSVLFLSGFALSGFTISNGEKTSAHHLAEGGDPVGMSQANNETPPGVPENVIHNGSFEEWSADPLNGVGDSWGMYDNGRAHVGWYEETWPEAVHSGEKAQLLEIADVEGTTQSRAVAIYQTVDVVPNSEYMLSLYALLRSMAPEGDRNKNDFEMNWGIDYSGEGNYDNVEMWHYMPLEEQYRLGSHGDYPDNKPLFYELITGTVQTKDSSEITLFIRGFKKFATMTEVNFDVDEVSLVGPYQDSGTEIESSPVPQASSPGKGSDLPKTGLALRPDIPVGSVILGGLMIVLLSGAAAYGLLLRDE